MSPATVPETTSLASPTPANPPKFTHQIEIRPLGHLYGSAGPFLSPDNLVGRAGNQFPPSAMTFAGLVAAAVGNEKEIKPYQFAGPFWAWNRDSANIYVPTPFNCLVKNNQIQHQMAWHGGKWQVKDTKTKQWQTPKDDKYQSGTWLDLKTWQQLDPTQPRSLPVAKGPWEFTPHLHPKLNDQERTTLEGKLFLENAVALNPEACLVYLCNHPVQPGWYRFGGEGHMVEVSCCEISTELDGLLNQNCDRAFATITPAVWGSNRRSLRAPRTKRNGAILWPRCRNGQIRPEDEHSFTQICTVLTGKPIPQRHRIGKPKSEYRSQTLREPPSLLSRGRYAMPAGTVYVLATALELPWHAWPDKWFPYEGYSYKRFGCGLALPLNVLV